MSALKKDPGDVIDFWFDWGSDEQALEDRWLPADENITAATVTTPDIVVQEDSDFTDKVVRVRVSGGELGEKGEIKCDIMTNHGQTFYMAKILQIKERIQT